MPKFQSGVLFRPCSNIKDFSARPSVLVATKTQYIGPTEFVYFVDSIQIKHRKSYYWPKDNIIGGKIWDIFVLYGLSVRAACMGWALFNECCYLAKLGRL